MSWSRVCHLKWSLPVTIVTVPRPGCNRWDSPDRRGIHPPSCSEGGSGHSASVLGLARRDVPAVRVDRLTQPLDNLWPLGRQIEPFRRIGLEMEKER